MSRMKKHLFILLLALISLPRLSAQYTQLPQGDTLRVLAIGNSFSVDATAYLQEIAAAAGKPMIIGNLFIPGCSIETHFENSLNDDQPYIYYKNIAGHKTEQHFSLAQGIKDESWDVITFQQASPLSGQYESFFPELAELMEFVKDSVSNPRVRFMWHMTWAYAQNSDHEGFAQYAHSQMKMHQLIELAAYRVKESAHFSSIIPVGTAIYNCRNSKIGDHVTRDGYHLNEIGRYAAACTWLEVLFGESALDITWHPEHISKKQASICKNAARYAVKYTTQKLEAVKY